MQPVCVWQVYGSGHLTSICSRNFTRQRSKLVCLPAFNYSGHCPARCNKLNLLSQTARSADLKTHAEQACVTLVFCNTSSDWAHYGAACNTLCGISAVCCMQLWTAAGGCLYSHFVVIVAVFVLQFLSFSALDSPRYKDLQSAVAQTSCHRKVHTHTHTHYHIYQNRICVCNNECFCFFVLKKLRL